MYRLINYTDVWGNEKDGYEVNNLCIAEENIHIEDDATNKEIAEYLVKIGYLTTSDMRRIHIEMHGDLIEIYQKKGLYPLGRLELMY